MAQGGTGRHSIAQYGTVWHRAAQYGTGWHSMAQAGTGWHSMAQGSTGWHRAAQSMAPLAGTVWQVSLVVRNLSLPGCTKILGKTCVAARFFAAQVPPEYGSVLEASHSLPGHLATGVSADVTLTFTPKVRVHS